MTFLKSFSHRLAPQLISAIRSATYGLTVEPNQAKYKDVITLTHDTPVSSKTISSILRAFSSLFLTSNRIYNSRAAVFKAFAGD